MQPRRLLRVLALAALAVLAAAEAAAQRPRQGGGPASRVNREQMWFAPTAEDWKKPCLIKWQRTWDDALALQREQRRPILVCVNMDGEIASEHYAGVRYRRPETAKLYEPYICVVASTHRHTPRDYDEQGNRIPCPRFGGVTCGEHIWIEPIIYEKFLEGRRIAPRHIAVDLDGKEMYDVFYAWDTDSVFKAIKDGAQGWPPPQPPRGDRPLAERAKSRDSSDRDAVETAYRQGDANLRRALLDAAAKEGGDAATDLLRLAVYGMDADAAAAARKALAQSQGTASVELINEALRVPLEAGERDALVGALDRLGQKSTRARTLAVVHKGLAGGAKTVDAAAWKDALAADGAKPAADPDTPAEAAPFLDAAEGLMKQAMKPTASVTVVHALMGDARTQALKAEAAGAKGRRVNAALAVAAYYGEDVPEALRRAEAAVKGVPNEPDGLYSMIALGLFADARREGIRAALRDNKPWPGEWLADVHAAYAVLAKHPFGEDTHVAAHVDFLRDLGALGESGRTLDEGLKRFPTSDALHQRLRDRALEERGVSGLEAVYEPLLKEKDAPPAVERFAAFASRIAAEYHRRERRETEADKAYDRAIAHYDAATKADPTLRDVCDREAAVCLGGKARLAFEAGALDRALDLVVKSFDRHADASNELDGLNVSSVDTAKQIRSKLRELKNEPALARLEAALGKLHPSKLELPAFEFENPPPNAGGAGGAPQSRPAGGRRGQGRPPREGAASRPR
jgi:hypothetical protein